MSFDVSSYDVQQLEPHFSDPIVYKNTMADMNSKSKVPKSISKTSLVWNNLSYEVTKKVWTIKGIRISREVQHKQILQPQNGEIVGGTLTAIMGPSGAGKSTLLNCLTGRYLSNVSGEVSITCPGPKPKSTIAFVPQQSELFNVFTVEETLMFASQLKNFKPNVNHRYEVDKIIKWLDLKRCADVKVGVCSGGQLKRVCIGVELISNPDILVLDEPTTGLDSSMAALCVQLLRIMTESSDYPPAIVATIHQPNYKILNEFHKIYLLSRYGQNIFFGSPSQMVDYFGEFNLHCPVNCNPADYAMEVAYGDYGENCFKQMGVKTRSTCYTDTERGMKFPMKKVVNKLKYKKLPAWQHIKLLVARNWSNLFLDSTQFWFKNLVAIIIPILVAHVWLYYVGEDDCCWSGFMPPINITEVKESFFKINVTAAKQEYLVKISRSADNTALLFMMGLFVAGINLMPGVLSFPNEVNTIVNEVANNWYNLSNYYWAKNLSDFPFQLMSNLIIVGIIYPTTGQIPEMWRFLTFFGLLSIIGELCHTIGMFFGILLSRDIVSAALVTTASSIPNLIFSGFVVRMSGMPWIFQKLSYISYLRFSFESLLIAIYGFGRCQPDTSSNLIADFTSASNPSEVAKNVLETLNITTRDTMHFSSLLDVDYTCLSSIFNGTNEYLGIGVTDDYDDVIGSNETMLYEVDAQQDPSYIMSYYQLVDSQLYTNIMILLLMLVLAKIAVYGVLIRKTRRTQ